MFLRALLATALAILVAAPVAHAALCIRLSTTAARPVAGDATIIKIKTFVPVGNGLKPWIVRKYPFRVEAVSAREKVFRVTVKPSPNPYVWRGTFRFPSAGVWTVGVTNWAPYAKGCGETLLLRVRAS